jgi:ribonuclease HII
VAGAVLLEDAFAIPEQAVWRLADSKVLSRAQREVADIGIRQTALAYGLGWVGSEEVDKLRLTAAVALAMERAVVAVETMLQCGAGNMLPASTTKVLSLDAVDSIIIDGSINYLPKLPQATAIIKADGSVAAVSAASILAKVARDQWMATEAERLYPGYGFARHAGYGTKAHQAALASLGICNLHRRSFRPVAALC